MIGENGLEIDVILLLYIHKSFRRSYRQFSATVDHDLAVAVSGHVSHSFQKHQLDSCLHKLSALRYESGSCLSRSVQKLQAGI